MTREEAKELIPVIQAFADGKTIQTKFRDKSDWFDIKKGDNASFNPEWCDYRIKPESNYRPFRTRRECWDEMLKHQPFGWLKSKKNGSFCCIGEVSWSDAFRDVHIKYSTSESLSRSSGSVSDEYTFADGTQFGIREE